MPITVQSYTPDLHLPPRVYFDTAVLVALIDTDHAHHLIAVDVIGSSLKQHVSKWISDTVLQEFWHTLLGSWRHRTDGSRKVVQTTVREFAQPLRDRTVDLLALKFEIIPYQIDSARPFHATALDIVASRYLKPRDGFHAAYALECGADALVSFDGDFPKLAGYPGTMTIIHIATPPGVGPIPATPLLPAPHSAGPALAAPSG